MSDRLAESRVDRCPTTDTVNVGVICAPRFLGPSTLFGIYFESYCTSSSKVYRCLRQPTVSDTHERPKIRIAEQTREDTMASQQQQLVMAVHHVATPTAKVGGLGSGG